MYDILFVISSKIKPHLGNVLKFMISIIISGLCLLNGSRVAFALDDSIFSNYSTYVKDSDNHPAWKGGTTSLNGSVSVSISVDVTSEDVTISSNNGSIGYNAGCFISAYPLKSGDIVNWTYSVSSDARYYYPHIGIKATYDTEGLPTYNADLTDSNILLNLDPSVSTFTCESDGYFYFYVVMGADNLNATLSISSLTVTSVDSEGNLTTEEILNKGNDATVGIIEDFNDRHNELQDYINNYDDLEQSFKDQFESGQSGIMSDFIGWSWGGLVSCASWISDTMVSYFDNMGDFKQYILYPLMMGIALFFIGRGSVIVASLTRDSKNSREG